MHHIWIYDDKLYRLNTKKEMDHKRDQVTCWIDSSQLIMARVKLPNASQAEIAQMLPFILEDWLIDDLSDKHWVYFPYQKDWLDVIIVPEKSMQTWMDILKQADIKPAFMYPDIGLLPLDSPDQVCVYCSKDRVLARFGDNIGFGCRPLEAPALLMLYQQELSKQSQAQKGSDDSTEVSTQQALPDENLAAPEAQVIVYQENQALLPKGFEDFKSIETKLSRLIVLDQMPSLSLLTGQYALQASVLGQFSFLLPVWAKLLRQKVLWMLLGVVLIGALISGFGVNFWEANKLNKLSYSLAKSLDPSLSKDNYLDVLMAQYNKVKIRLMRSDDSSWNLFVQLMEKMANCEDCQMKEIKLDKQFVFFQLTTHEDKETISHWFENQIQYAVQIESQDKNIYQISINMKEIKKLDK